MVRRLIRPICEIAVTEFLPFVLIYLIPARYEDVFMSKTASQCIVAEGFRALMLSLDRLACWITDVMFFHNIDKKRSDLLWRMLCSVMGKRRNGCTITSRAPYFCFIGDQRRISSWQKMGKASVTEGQ